MADLVAIGSANLAARVEWRQAAAVYGWDVGGVVLPSAVRCAACRCVAHLYQDTSIGGVWHVCTRCGFTGDIFDVISKLTGKTVTAAIGDANARGLVEGGASVARVDRYVLGVRCPREDHITSAAHACASLPDSPNREFRKRFFCEDASPLTWKDRGGAVVGVLDSEDASRLGLDLKGDSGVVIGRDLPGRVAGFWVVAPLDDGWTMTWNGWLPEAVALSGLTDRFPVGDGILVVTDPRAAAVLYVRGLRVRDEPPQVVGWACGEPPPSLRSWMHSRKVVVWSQHVDPVAARLAVGEDRRLVWDDEFDVSCAWSPSVSVDNVMKITSARSRPLGECLTRMLADPKDMLLCEAVLREVEKEGVRLPAMIADAAALRNLNTILYRGIRGAVVVVRGKEIYSTPAGWIGPRQEVISEATVTLETLKLDRLTGDGKRPTATYYGTIRYKSTEFEFEMSESVASTRLLQAVRDICVEKGLGCPIYSATWNRFGLEIATAFHPPTRCHSLLSYGWNDTMQAFVVPGGLVQNGNVITTDAGMPAAPVDMKLTPEDFAMAAADNELEAIWLCACVILTSHLATAHGVRSPSYAAIGRGSKGIGKAIKSLIGSQKHQTVFPAPRKISGIEQADELLQIGNPLFSQDSPEWAALAAATKGFVIVDADVEVYGESQCVRLVSGIVISALVAATKDGLGGGLNEETVVQRAKQWITGVAQAVGYAASAAAGLARIEEPTDELIRREFFSGIASLCTGSLSGEISVTVDVDRHAFVTLVESNARFPVDSSRLNDVVSSAPGVTRCVNDGVYFWEVPFTADSRSPYRLRPTRDWLERSRQRHRPASSSSP